MSSKRQPHLPGFGKLSIKEFGGTSLKGNPREARPLSTKRPVHLVMRSSLAKGDRSLLKRGRSQEIEKLVRSLAKAKGVKLYRFANSGNHLHFLMLPSSRRAFQAYIRAISGVIARMSLGVERGRAKGIRFWDARPFTRIVEWGREFKTVSAYVIQNTLEAIGFIPYQTRKLKHRSALAPG
jgi:REP element-mobilizing transposase RayT